LTTVYFTDRDLGRLFPRLLRESGIRVEEHRDHFAHDAADTEWLAAMRDRHWVVVTHDRRIRYKPNELDAVMRSEIALLIVVGKVKLAELAANFVRTIDRIESFLASHQRPFIAKVWSPRPDESRRHPGAPGRVEMWLSRADWLARRR
jgi:hypothetical protein